MTQPKKSDPSANRDAATSARSSRTTALERRLRQEAEHVVAVPSGLVEQTLAAIKARAPQRESHLSTSNPWRFAIAAALIATIGAGAITVRAANNRTDTEVQKNPSPVPPLLITLIDDRVPESGAAIIVARAHAPEKTLEAEWHRLGADAAGVGMFLLDRLPLPAKRSVSP